MPLSLRRPAAPPTPPAEDQLALFVSVAWGEGHLDANQLEHLGPITLGELQGSLQIPGITPGRVLAERYLNGARIHLPAGAELRRGEDRPSERQDHATEHALGPKESLAYRYQGLDYTFSLVEGHATRGHTGAITDWGMARTLAVSMLAHAFWITTTWLTPASTERHDEWWKSRGAVRVVQLVRGPEVKTKSAGGQPGPEGRRGDPKRRPADAAPSQTKGAPRVDPRTVAANTQIARRAGLLGILASMPGDAANTVLGSGGLGTGLNLALNGLRGAELTQAGGFGGLGSRGTDPGGGGGSIGIGGIGRGPGSGPGEGLEVGLPGRKRGPEVRRGGRTIQQGDGLTQEEIARVIRGALPRIKFCYEKELQADPNLSGKAPVAFTIAPNGAVAEANLRDSTLGNPAAEACLTQVIRTLKFPAPRGGGVVIVTYPFIFETQR